MVSSLLSRSRRDGCTLVERITRLRPSGFAGRAFPALKQRRLGFTLVELIIVIAIIAIIAAVIFVAIDPARRLNASRNSRRWRDVNSVLSAIKTFQADNASGALAGQLQVLTAPVSRVLGTAVPNSTCTACAGVTPALPATACGLDFNTTLSAYIKSMPFDPSVGSASDTRYYVTKDANGVVEVGACNEQGEGAGGGGTAPTISVAQ